MAKLSSTTIKQVVKMWETYREDYPTPIPMDEKIAEFANWYEEDQELKAMKQLHADKTGLWKVFWDVYPRKVGKKNAMRAFMKLSPKEQDLATAMVPKYKILTDRYQPDYLHPSTYLNQERFKDDELKAIPTGKQIENFFTFAKKILNANELNQFHIIKAARLIMVHKATANEARQVALWMKDVWGSDAEWRDYVNLNTLLNDKKWKERVLKAKDYLNGK
jgi:hypothetical protein